ncbi:Period circadian protein like protein 1 [Aphelenchoides fujianensis]|nr:Period circadian protein like protein 1 [Aphelenchoides fujianensis]
MGTLVVSLPSGRVLDVAYSAQTATCRPAAVGVLRERGRHSLGEKLDGKGGQILTLQAFCGTPKPRMFARLKAAVPFLCHFPSEKTGASLHSIVHKEDVIRLHDVHGQLRAGKRVVRCGSLRFVAHDGRVWNVDSEFAAFINPWSNSVEMVVAKHRVIALVDQVNPADVLLSDAQCRENDLIARSILEGPQEPTPVHVEEKAGDATLVPPTAVSPPLTKTSGGSSPAQTPDLLLSYNQINCLENVHRLLKSQSAPGSRASQSTATSTSSAARSAPLTRELLGEHDRRWQAEKTRCWTRRLQLKRANPTTTAVAPPLKIARTEPTSPSGSDRSEQPQPAQLHRPSGLLAQPNTWTSGGSTPSNL